MSIKKTHPLITGTILLTITGLISRVIGFYYRIHLTRLFGEEGMGIYQLLGPILALSFSLTGTGFQTAISKHVAEYTANHVKSKFIPMLVGLCISLPLSLICCTVLYQFSDFIAIKVLLEPRTASMIRILAPSVPFSAVHACLNGYFYGEKKAAVPALSQLAEQLTRVGCVYFLTYYLASRHLSPSINIAVWGLTIGEFVSMLVAMAAIRCSNLFSTGTGILSTCASLMKMVLPLTANRIILNLLQSVESVSIPARLALYGYTHSQALSVYGVLTGMAMPLIFFPNALTSSMAVLLLPLISENYAIGALDVVKASILRTLKYCSLMG
ncbi:MAG: oligosaccharide flippase family protein, partial [Acetatifactor sp.]|nr:oligosaccharide flippase family protein [Acetatifactor sp.]